jgi:hypothetical protein
MQAEHRAVHMARQDAAGVMPGSGGAGDQAFAGASAFAFQVHGALGTTFLTAGILVAVLGRGDTNNEPWVSLQGTNAHVIMCHTDSSSTAAAAVKDIPWQRRRLWFAPPPHLLLQRALVVARGVVQLATLLGRTQLAYLWDHQVASCPHWTLQSKQADSGTICSQQHAAGSAAKHRKCRWGSPVDSSSNMRQHLYSSV